MMDTLKGKTYAHARVCEENKLEKTMPSEMILWLKILKI